MENEKEDDGEVKGQRENGGKWREEGEGETERKLSTPRNCNYTCPTPFTHCTHTCRTNILALIVKFNLSTIIEIRHNKEKVKQKV